MSLQIASCTVSINLDKPNCCSRNPNVYLCPYLTPAGLGDASDRFFQT